MKFKLNPFCSLVVLSGTLLVTGCTETKPNSDVNPGNLPVQKQNKKSDSSEGTPPSETPPLKPVPPEERVSLELKAAIHRGELHDGLAEVKLNALEKQIIALPKDEGKKEEGPKNRLATLIRTHMAALREEAKKTPPNPLVTAQKMLERMDDRRSPEQKEAREFERRQKELAESLKANYERAKAERLKAQKHRDPEASGLQRQPKNGLADFASRLERMDQERKKESTPKSPTQDEKKESEHVESPRSTTSGYSTASLSFDSRRPGSPLHSSRASNQFLTTGEELDRFEEISFPFKNASGEMVTIHTKIHTTTVVHRGSFRLTVACDIQDQNLEDLTGDYANQIDIDLNHALPSKPDLSNLVALLESTEVRLKAIQFSKASPEGEEYDTLSQEIRRAVINYCFNRRAEAIASQLMESLSQSGYSSDDDDTF
jgi:hypothetical protein